MRWISESVLDVVDMSTSHVILAAMMADLKPGDRFEVALTGSPGRLSLPAVLGPDGFAIEQIEDDEGQSGGVGRSIPRRICSSCPSLPKSSRSQPTHCGWNIRHRADFA